MNEMNPGRLKGEVTCDECHIQLIIQFQYICFNISVTQHLLSLQHLFSLQHIFYAFHG